MHTPRPYAVRANGSGIAVRWYACITKPVFEVALLAGIHLINNITVAVNTVSATPQSVVAFADIIHIRSLSCNRDCAWGLTAQPIEHTCNDYPRRLFSAFSLFNAFYYYGIIEHINLRLDLFAHICNWTAWYGNAVTLWKSCAYSRAWQLYVCCRKRSPHWIHFAPYFEIMNISRSIKPLVAVFYLSCRCSVRNIQVVFSLVVFRLVLVAVCGTHYVLKRIISCAEHFIYLINEAVFSCILCIYIPAIL